MDAVNRRIVGNRRYMVDLAEGVRSSGRTAHLLRETLGGRRLAHARHVPFRPGRRPFTQTRETPMTRSHQAGLSAAALSLLAAAAPVGGQQAVATPRSAPISNVRYEVTFDRASAAVRRLRVATTFD